MDWKRVRRCLLAYTDSDLPAVILEGTTLAMLAISAYRIAVGMSWKSGPSFVFESAGSRPERSSESFSVD